jgi:hypothetical protein
VPTALLPIVVSGNLLNALRGNGLVMETPMLSARIEHNVFNGIVGSGIVMSDGSGCGTLSVHGNELLNLVTETTERAAFEYAAIYLQNVLSGNVTQNTINVVGAQAARAEVVAGIRLDGCRDVRVSDNSIATIGAADGFANLAAGVLVLAPLNEIDIADNVVRRQLILPDKAEADQANWNCIRILGAEAEGVLPVKFATFTTLSVTQQISSIDHFAAATASPTERVGITSNSLHGYGRSPAVDAFLTGSCRFSDNEASVLGSKPPFAVELRATTIVAASNRVTFEREKTSLDLRFPGKPIFTAVGNIVTGPIRANGATLSGTPWDPLNVLAP